MRALVFRSAYSASRNARASAAFAASIKAHRAVFSETLMLQVRCARPPVGAPNQLFKLLRCSAWLIHDFAPSPMRALVFRSAYSASRNARASAAFAASIKAHRAVSSETLMLQVRFARPPPAHRTSSPSCSGVPVGFFSKRPCYGLFSKTLDLQVRFAHPPVDGGSSAPPCTPLSCPRKCGDRQAAIPLCGKSSLSEHAMDFPSALHTPKEACPFLRTPPRPAAKRAAATRAATPLPPPASSFFLTARSSFRTSRRP